MKFVFDIQIPDQEIFCEKEIEVIEAIPKQFHHNAHQIQPTCSKKIEFTNKSCTQATTDKILLFLDTFKRKVMSLKLQDQQLNTIFECSEDLVRNVNELSLNLMNDDSEITTVQALETSTQFICAKLDQLKTTFKRRKHYAHELRYVHPKEMAIGTRWEMKKFRRINKRTGTSKIIKIPRMIQCTFQYVSILNTLKSLFNQDDFMEMYFDYNSGEKRHRCDGKYSSFCCGETFKNSQFFDQNPEAIQIQLAWDDFEICCPLKSKANLHKLCGIYFTIRNLPTKYLSKIANIYVVALITSDDLKAKHTDMNNIWYPIVKEIQSLENDGIQLKNGSTIKGTLIQSISDNLGANIGLGFSAGFSKGPYYCRICLCSKEECDQLSKEDSTKIRTKADYDHRIQIIAESTKINFHETKGVKFYCQLSDLQNYHILDNPTLDIMHDFNEGAIPYLLDRLLVYIFKNNILSEGSLKSRLQFFNFGWLNSQNVPSELRMEKHNLGQNAAQARCLLTYLPFILYEYLDNPKLKIVWNCFESLLKISEIIYSNLIDEIDCQMLQSEVTSFLEGIQRHFNGKFIPKLHFMLHYPYVIRKSGPLVHMNMFRTESKHKQLKDFAVTSRNFRNINKTIIIKHQQWIVEQGFTYRNNITHSIPFALRDETFIDNKKIFEEHFHDRLQNIYEIISYDFNSFEYRKNMFIIYNRSIFEIQTLLFDNSDEKAYFLCKKFKVISFEARLNSFQIEENIYSAKQIISFSSLDNLKPYECVELGSRNFLVSNTLDLKKSTSI